MKNSLSFIPQALMVMLLSARLSIRKFTLFTRRLLSVKMISFPLLYLFVRSNMS